MLKHILFATDVLTTLKRQETKKNYYPNNIFRIKLFKATKLLFYISDGKLNIIGVDRVNCGF
jgi:hypothetical protein